LTNKKIYFASDFHLGIPNINESHDRERRIVRWLTEIEQDAKSIYLVGDIFDFWFEYKKVVPKGYVRLLGKLANLKDNGIQIHLFVGNHDLWVNDYLEKEVGVIIHHRPTILVEQNKKIFICHGDGLGDGDYFYKFIRKIFTSKISKWIFARLHPNFGISIAHAWSKESRKKKEDPFKSKEKELLFDYAKKHQKSEDIDYYIFGHRHIPLNLKIDANARYVNLGDWIINNTYAVLEDGVIKLKKFVN
jgi:UDP-2,3-diacylglucosamine hydrolase